MTRMAETARAGEVEVGRVGRPQPFEAGGARVQAEGVRSYSTGLRLAAASGMLRGPEKYRQLDLRRRRAQIRARRVLGLG